MRVSIFKENTAQFVSLKCPDFGLLVWLMVLLLLKDKQNSSLDFHEQVLIVLKIFQFNLGSIYNP